MIDPLERAAGMLAERHSGPGGAACVVHEGRVLLRGAWGFADPEARLAFTPRTPFRVCSITKQFTCALLLSALSDPEVLAPALSRRLPKLCGTPPRIVDLCHNQSGLRDYWAEAMLHGARPEDRFGEREAAAVIAATRTLQFPPGTAFSYCNQNFRLLSDLLSDHLEDEFATLLRTRVLEPAGMSGAWLGADTSDAPGGTRGYEGTAEGGFRAAVNNIVWTGDAGLIASLDDMIAWERWIDETRAVEGGLYARLSAPVRFLDGAPAGYGFGLRRARIAGQDATGHGGALRGWRSCRLHLARSRLSVVVLFNHMAEAQGAARMLLETALEVVSDPRPSVLGGQVGPAGPAKTGVSQDAAPEEVGDLSPCAPSRRLDGIFLDPATGLCAHVWRADGQWRLRYGHHESEILVGLADGSARSDSVTLRALDEGDAPDLEMTRIRDNLVCRLSRRTGLPSADIAGAYVCGEIDARLEVIATGGVLYGAFSGRLGRGTLEALVPMAEDLWLLPCRRALDHAPPGDWTLSVLRADDGGVSGIEVGCWLARGYRFARAA